jgi:hypothetical protein
VSIDEALARLEGDRELHMLTGPATPADIVRIEQAVGRLPSDLHALLTRVGGGLLYERHEVFGPHRLMIHDIELVPDILSMRKLVQSRGGPLKAGFLPIHRVGGLLHLVDLRDARATIVSETLDRSWADLATFLSAVVLPG